MTKEGGETFDLISFDFAGFPLDAEVTLTVTGQPGNVEFVFEPDCVVNGPGPPDDFENVTLPASFSKLSSVTFEQYGFGTIAGALALDNLTVGKPISVDEQSWGGIKAAYK